MNRVVLAYRAEEEMDWREAAAVRRGALEYEATVDLDPERNWAYCIVARRQGVARSSDIRQLDLRDKFAAPGAVFACIEQRRQTGSQVVVDVLLRQRPKPLLPWRCLEDAELFPRTRDGRELPGLSFQRDDTTRWKVSCAFPPDVVEATVRVRFADGTTAEGLLPLDGWLPAGDVILEPPVRRQ